MTDPQDIRCIVVDDEPLAVRLLGTYVERHPRLQLAGAFTDPADALKAIGRGGIDLAFLDIEMPGMNGIELARAAEGSGMGLIFVTAYRDYAFEGFRVRALDYLLKPVSYAEFAEAVGRVASLIKPLSHISVRSDWRQIRIDIRDIKFIRGLKDYVKIVCHGRARPILTQMTMKEIEAVLPGGFIRVHRSYIVNKEWIDSVEGGFLNIQEHAIPIGPTYRSEVESTLK